MLKTVYQYIKNVFEARKNYKQSRLSKD